jgi:hypothetical protein
MNSYSAKVVGYAGHRARDPPDPIPNSEVKPRSVSGVSVVFGHAKPGKLAAPLPDCTLVCGREILKIYYRLSIVYFEEKNK